jgi:hypothetical protein
MAGEGSIEERGWSPLSNSFPLSNIIEMERRRQTCLRGGVRGVSKRTPVCKQNPRGAILTNKFLHL